ncbi:transporter [Pueribacillus theae]|uniref:Transporter n=1 Tax=Pueribacillus theae TaxID=2171751 RepID=A0A2U1JYQ7_9BACI|nr:chromate transporter [Pueribacillus theae]PWA10084.1 transporter [Pueribacillus theae]
MDLKSYYEIAAAMLRAGIFGYGGGPSVIPLFKHEAVNRYKWMKDEEFAEVLAFANALPGPIATKMAAQIGYQQKGALGAVIAVLAHILPTSLAIIALLSVMYTLKESAIVAGMIAAVRPIIAVMLGLIAYEFCVKTWKGLGQVYGAIFGVIAFLLLMVFHVHPVIAIIIFLAYGTVHIRFSNWISDKRKDRDKEGGVSL